ncbi:DUF2789 domain-containing protein [Pseudaeromonas paramecii]|uniref:DUF2789 domain-containing protein n=1 Tax=Pseudaeromonas paramecii TaxID=2138166 RepID=A0ABP8QA46_9GAMM
MESQLHGLPALFRQLGLADDPEAIRGFVAAHAPLEDGLALHDAGFWSPAQAQFLRQSKADDADWAEVVDQLDVMLRR